MKFHIKDFILSTLQELSFPGLKKKIIAEDTMVVPMEIAKTGTFAGYSDGEFSLTEDIFSEAIANFYSEENPLPVYRGHADVVASERGIEEPPAVGWILGLSQENGRLYAAVELSKEIEDQIKAGNYKYTSIYLRSEETHRETGEDIGSRLISLALTNQPFILGCTEIQLSDFRKSKHIYLSNSQEEKMTKQIKATEEPVTDEAKALEIAEEMVEGKTEEDTTLAEDSMKDSKEEEDVVVANELEMLETARQAVAPDLSLEDFIKQLLATVMPEEAVMAETTEEPKEEESVEASKAMEEIKKIEASNLTLSSVKRMSVVLSQLKNENKALKQELDKAKDVILSSEISEYVKAGVIQRAEKEDYIELAKTNRSLFDRMIQKKSSNKMILSRLTQSTPEKKESSIDLSNLSVAERRLMEAYYKNKK